MSEIAARRIARITAALQPTPSAAPAAALVPLPTAAETKAAAGAGGPSVFAGIKRAPLDPILGTSIMYNNDKDSRKVNLGIGAYRTDEGKPLVLNCVKKAIRLLAYDETKNLEYLPQNGDANFNRACKALLFGANNPALNRIATMQTLSGTGSLRVGAAFINMFLSNRTVYYSDPTWGNHITILQHARVPGRAYRYWDEKNRRLDIKGMCEDLRAAPEGSVILLHACAHNPTGVDPNQAEWKQIAAVCKERRHIPYFDSAYQGFASGDLEKDAWALRYFVSQGFECIVSQSFAKNFGLYGERIGALHIVCADASKVEDVVSQINIIIRAMYSNPPKHGAEIVTTVLTNPELQAEWRRELVGMAQRIIRMRTLLEGTLRELGTPGDWSHITAQIGMFSYTGLSEKQCEQLIAKHHIYLLKSGRISMAGVNSSNVRYLAQAIDDVVRNVRS